MIEVLANTDVSQWPSLNGLTCYKCKMCFESNVQYRFHKASECEALGKDTRNEVKE